MSIIDFHAHILPNMDDGSNSLEKSLEMYSLSMQQGVDCIVATPHFYAQNDRVEDFLERRAQAYQAFLEIIQSRDSTERQNVSDVRLRVIPGAEVAYFPGISEAEKLSQLTVQGTNLLLLELPFDSWGETIYKETAALIEECRMTVIFAHLERYLQIPDNKKYIRELLELPVYVQINAGSLLDWRKKRKVMKLFDYNTSVVLGSDMHGVNRRPPNLEEGRQILRKRFGSEMLDHIDETGKRLLRRQE